MTDPNEAPTQHLSKSSQSTAQGGYSGMAIIHGKADDDSDGVKAE